MQSVTLPIEFANRILAYLGTRPYQEVAGLIAGLHQVAQEQQQAENVKPGPIMPEKKTNGAEAVAS